MPPHGVLLRKLAHHRLAPSDLDFEFTHTADLQPDWPRLTWRNGIHGPVGDDERQCVGETKGPERHIHRAVSESGGTEKHRACSERWCKRDPGVVLLHTTSPPIPPAILLTTKHECQLS